MPRGNGSHRNFVDGVSGLPPIHFLNLRIARDAIRGQARADTERNGKSRMPLRADAAQRGNVKMIVMVVALQHQINRRKLVEMNSWSAVARRSNPGRGLARCDQIGSHRMFSPSSWISTDECPTNVARIFPSLTRSGGVSPGGASIHLRQAAGLRVSIHLSTPAVPCIVAPSRGLKKCSPSKW